MRSWWNSLYAMTLVTVGCGGAAESPRDIAVDQVDLNQGQACAGPKGGACAQGSYCNVAQPGICPGPETTGVCATAPEVCNDLFNPVCGCDRQTYPNECYANRAGVGVASTGECPARQACGGFAGIRCPGRGVCVDDPSDDCNPDAGAVDCGGVCTCVENVLCVRGFHFDSSPAVCACVADGNPCAAIFCPVGTRCVVNGSTASCEPHKKGCGGPG
jgi:hypothetical protein